MMTEIIQSIYNESPLYRINESRRSEVSALKRDEPSHSLPLDLQRLPRFRTHILIKLKLLKLLKRIPYSSSPERRRIGSRPPPGTNNQILPPWRKRRFSISKILPNSEDKCPGILADTLHVHLEFCSAKVALLEPCARATVVFLVVSGLAPDHLFQTALTECGAVGGEMWTEIELEE